MLADLDRTLRKLLIEGLNIQPDEIDISFEQPTHEWRARLTRPSINLFLYDIHENNVLRQHQWEKMAKNNGDGRISLKRTPFRLDCTYVLTAWANDVLDEHRLLTQAMRILFRYPLLPADRLEGALQNHPYDIQTTLAAHDRLTNPAELWTALDNELRPSIPYTVTIALDPWQPIEERLVQTYELGLHLKPDDRSEEKIHRQTQNS